MKHTRLCQSFKSGGTRYRIYDKERFRTALLAVVPIWGGIHWPFIVIVNFKFVLEYFEYSGQDGNRRRELK